MPEAQEALRKLEANATSLVCHRDWIDRDSPDGRAAAHTTRTDDHHFFLISSLEFMQLAVHRASDLGYMSLEQSARGCERLHFRIQRSRNNLIRSDDDLFELDNAITRKRKVVERLLQQLEAFKLAEAEAHSKAQALSRQMSSAGLDERQLQWCREAITQMEIKERDANHGALHVAQEMSAPEEDLRALRELRQRAIAETLAMHMDVNGVQEAAVECDAGVAALRRGVGVLAKHSRELLALLDSVRAHAQAALE